MTNIQLEGAVLDFSPAEAADSDEAAFDLKAVEVHNNAGVGDGVNAYANIDRKGAVELYDALGEWLGLAHRGEVADLVDRQEAIIDEQGVLISDLIDTVEKLDAALRASQEHAIALAGVTTSDAPSRLEAVADFPRGDSDVRKVDVGTTQGPLGWVFISADQATGDKYKLVVTHFSPEKAAEVYAALGAAIKRAQVERACGKTIPNY